MFKEIAFYQILGKPLVMYGGIVTLPSFLYTALLSHLNSKWHPRMAVISITLGLIHGGLGILALWI